MFPLIPIRTLYDPFNPNKDPSMIVDPFRALGSPDPEPHLARGADDDPRRRLHEPGRGRELNLGLLRGFYGLGPKVGPTLVCVYI